MKEAGFLHRGVVQRWGGGPKNLEKDEGRGAYPGTGALKPGQEN